MDNISNSVHWRVAKDHTFCGRTQIIKNIVNGLKRNDSFAVVGQRGMGKTMLSRKLSNQRKSNNTFDPVCLPIRCTGKEESAFSLVETFRDKLVDTISQKLDKERKQICEVIGKGITPTKDKPILRMIEATESFVNSPVSVELFLDDVHRLRKHKWTPDLLANLEYELFGKRKHAQMFRCVFFGDLKMKSLLENLPFSDLWQQLRDVWMEPLDENDLLVLLESLESLSHFGDLKLMASLIYGWSGGYPVLTQYLLRDLLDRPERNVVEVIKSSANRFISELGKMLEASWIRLDKNSRTLIQMVTDSGIAFPLPEVASSMSLTMPQCSNALKEALASGLIRFDRNNVYQPGKAITLWLGWQETKAASATTQNRCYYKVQKSGSHFPTILHLSDLHFAGGGHAWDDPNEIPGVGRPTHDRLTLLETLVRDLRALQTENKLWWPKTVIVSGDLLYQGRQEGIKDAVSFLDRLSAELEIERTSVVICAGNHEQNRKVFREEPNAQLASYRKIWNDFYPTEFRSLPLDWSEDKYTHLFEVENLEILSLNSCEDLDPEPEGNEGSPKEQGYISMKQLEVASGLLGKEKPQNGHIRVAVLHHHLSQHKWTTGADYSILREVKRVIEWLRQYHFDLVFHGHQHCIGFQTQLLKERYITILAGGSAGVIAKHRWRGGMPLSYQLVYSTDKNRARRICRCFDLHAEKWDENQHYEAEVIPIGPLM